MIFRNSDNTKLMGTQAFQSHLSRNGFNTSFLQSTVFKSDKVGAIVSNKVGANVIARKEALQWIKDVMNNKVGKLGKDKQKIQKFTTTDFDTNAIVTNGNTEKNMEDTHQNKSNGMQSSKADTLAKDLQKEINDALAQFQNNDDSFWMGDKLDMLIDAEISEEEDKTVDRSLSISQEMRKAEKAEKLELGSLDYSWMDSFGCDANAEVDKADGETNGEENDNTLDLGPIDYSWMESLADDSDSDSHLVKDSNEGNKKTDQFKLDSLDYSWMDSMGCASDIEEDDLNSDGMNAKEILHADEKEIKVNFIQNKDTDTGFKEKTKELFVDRRSQETGEILDVGHFCAAWMDCFESITELDNNLKVRLEGTDSYRAEPEGGSSSLLLTKSTKDFLNHKIAEGLGDSSKTTIREKENEMFKLLEEVLLKQNLGHSEEAKILTNKLDAMKSIQMHNTLENKEGYSEDRDGDAKTAALDMKGYPSFCIPEAAYKSSSYFDDEEVRKAADSFNGLEDEFKKAAELFNGLEISPNNSNKKKMNTEPRLNDEPALDQADSDSSYLEEAENASTSGLRHKKQKNGKSLKRKFKKEKKIGNKINLLKLGAKKTLNKTDKEMTKSDVNNLLGKQSGPGFSGVSESPVQYSSDWETDEDDIDRQSSDELEDL